MLDNQVNVTSDSASKIASSMDNSEQGFTEADTGRGTKNETEQFFEDRGKMLDNKVTDQKDMV